MYVYIYRCQGHHSCCVPYECAMNPWSRTSEVRPRPSRVRFQLAQLCLCLGLGWWKPTWGYWKKWAPNGAPKPSMGSQWFLHSKVGKMIGDEHHTWQGVGNSLQAVFLKCYPRVSSAHHWGHSAVYLLNPGGRTSSSIRMNVSVSLWLVGFFTKKMSM